MCQSMSLVQSLLKGCVRLRLSVNRRFVFFAKCAFSIKDFLKQGVTKVAFCCALGDINQNSLNPFFMGKNQDQCGTICYPRAYRFFETKRILEGEKKLAHRLMNEAEHPNGFSLEKKRASKWVLVEPNRHLFGYN